MSEPQLLGSSLPLEPHEGPELRSLSAWERMLADYGSTGVTLREHPLELMRPGLPDDLRSSRELAAHPHGRRVRVAGLVVARQRPATARQWGQALTKRRVEPLDGGGIAHPVPLRATSEHLDARRRASHEAAFNLHQAPLRVAFDDLGKADIVPGTPPGPPRCARRHGSAQGLANGPEV